MLLAFLGPSIGQSSARGDAEMSLVLQWYCYSHNHCKNKNYYYNYRAHKKLSYCWETVRRESMPRIAEMDVEMTT